MCDLARCALSVYVVACVQTLYQSIVSLTRTCAAATSPLELHFSGVNRFRGKLTFTSNGASTDHGGNGAEGQEEQDG